MPSLRSRVRRVHPHPHDKILVKQIVIYQLPSHKTQIRALSQFRPIAEVFDLEHTPGFIPIVFKTSSKESHSQLSAKKDIMSSKGNQLIDSRKTLLLDNQSKFNETIKQIKEEIFQQLRPEDHKYLIKTSKLLSLRDFNPSKCTGESAILFNDPTVPPCWRARAGVYRAEALMILGFDKLAKDQLILAGRLLESDDHLEPIDLIDRNHHQILEGLVAWNIALGKINWGIVEGTNETKFAFKLTSKPKNSTSSGKLLSAGYPSSLSLSALDLKSC